MWICIGQEEPLIGRALLVVAGSNTEAEYVVACLASCEVVWLRKLLFDLFDLQMDATCIHCDNQSCVKLLENLVFHDKSKHIGSSITISWIWCREEQ